MLTRISVDTHKSKILKKCLLKSPNLCMKTNFNHILLNSFLWINATSVFYGLLFQTVLYGALPERNSQPWQAVAWAWVNACKNTAYFFLAFRNRLWRQDWEPPVWLFVIGFLCFFFYPTSYAMFSFIKLPFIKGTSLEVFQHKTYLIPLYCKTAVHSRGQLNYFPARWDAASSGQQYREELKTGKCTVNLHLDAPKICVGG